VSMLCFGYRRGKRRGVFKIGLSGPDFCGKSIRGFYKNPGNLKFEIKQTDRREKIRIRHKPTLIADLGNRRENRQLQWRSLVANPMISQPVLMIGMAAGNMP